MKLPAYMVMKTDGKTYVGTGKSARLSGYVTVFTNKFEEARIYTSLEELEEDCGWFSTSHKVVTIPVTVNVNEAEVFKIILKSD